MVNFLKFIQQYEAVIYFFLGGGALIYGWNFWKAWSEIRRAVFGLEQVSAQRRLNQVISILFLLLILGFSVLAIVTFSEEITIAFSQNNIERPQVDVIVTNTPIVESGEATSTPLPTVSLITEGCVKDVVEILEPSEGEVISGDIEVKGTVDIDDFGFYKLEIAEANQALWLTIQAGRNTVVDGVLVENWDTSLLPPGGYVLQLVVTTSSGEILTPCRIPITIGTTG